MEGIMISFDGYFSLSHRATFYVPSTDNGNDTISKAALQARVNEIAYQLTDWFGGATVERVAGYWRSDAGEYIVETIQRVTSYCQEQALEEHIASLLNLAAAKRIDWSQESIALEINGKMVFID
jgi:hypothetical protein